MTIKENIDLLRGLEKLPDIQQSTLSREAIDNAADFLNREKAVRPFTSFTCPNCAKPLSPTDYYCSYCGQRIDWSDTE